MINWCKENWPMLPFIGAVLLFIGSMVYEYYKGNCRIGKDIPICEYIDVNRTY